MVINKISLNKLLLNFLLKNSIKDDPFLKSFLIFLPNEIKNIIGKAVPSAYPITAPNPPQVAADAGPNNIQAPKADETKLVLKEKKPIFLFAVK